jgi:tripeptide aminopeptidase
MKKRSIDACERLILKLLAIPGPSGEEQAVMDEIAALLRAAGAPAECLAFDQAHRRSPRNGGQIGNLVCKLPGTAPGRRRLLMAHVDTVPLCRGARPVRRGRWIVPADKQTALGADDRAGATAILSAAIEIVRRGLPHPPLTFLWTVQEEIGLYGARFCSLGALGKPALAFNFDGGATDKVAVGATGGYRLNIHVSGRASHAGVVPEQGINAITVAALAIARLHRDRWLGRIEKDGRHGTSNIGVIRAGEATNVVTPSAELRAEARSHDPAFRREIVRAIQRAFRDAAGKVRSSLGSRGKVSFEGRLDYESFRLPDDDPSALEAEAVIRALGGHPIRLVSNGGLDANWMSARGIPTVTLGCGQANAHTTSERLDLGEFRQGCRMALRLATGT